MNLRIITIGLMILFFASCNENTKSEKKESQKEEIPTINFIKTLEGEIDEKYPIIAKIKCNSGIIKGNYYYKKVGQELELKGTIDSDGKITFKEFDNKGNQTGQFEGIYKDAKIEGIWSKPNGKKSMPFEMTESNTNYLSVKNEMQELKGLSGRYESSSGTVIINQKRGQEFNFDIMVANAKGCTGDLKGVVKIGINMSGKFSSKLCKELTFEFSKQELSIGEKSCDAHGMSCWFSGIYKKKI